MTKDLERRRKLLIIGTDLQNIINELILEECDIDIAYRHGLDNPWRVEVIHTWYRTPYSSEGTRVYRGRGSSLLQAFTEVQHSINTRE